MSVDLSESIVSQEQARGEHPAVGEDKKSDGGTFDVTGDDGRCIGRITKAEGEWIARLVKGGANGDDVVRYQTKADAETAIRDADKANDEQAEKSWRFGLTPTVVKEMERSAKAIKGSLKRIKSTTADKLVVGDEWNRLKKLKGIV